MATYYHANGGGNGGGNDWGSWIPIIVLFCIPTPVTWIIALIWLASKLRGGGKRGKNWQGGVKRHPYDLSLIHISRWWPSRPGGPSPTR